MFWDNFVKLCNSAGTNPNAVAKELDISSGSVTGWKKGAKPRDTAVNKIADYFGITTEQLKGDDISAGKSPTLPDNIFPITRTRYPLLGDIACGEPIYADEHRESYIMSGTEIQADFCLRAKGDSMTGARILDGDIVFIRSASMVENGAIAAVIIGDEATLKRVYWYPEEKRLRLQAENPAYRTMEFIGPELDTVRILGRAVAFQSDVL